MRLNPDRTVATMLRVLLLGLVLGFIRPDAAVAQSFRRGGTELNAMRTVTVPPGKSCSIVVTQFFHHGQISPDGRNVVVSAKSQKLVPARVLQLGPGDYCRLAFETLQGQSAYEVLYGGEPPAQDAAASWTSKDGLLLETREFQNCNLNDFKSVLDAFNAAKPIGADYVDTVQHSHNPFALAPGPFFSRYSGHLRISSPGTYRFFTSSQDCSFLLVDDKEVVEAPGMHGPTRNAFRARRRDVPLSAGTHKFEYLHAAAGPDAAMVAAWQVNPPNPDPKPAAIPPETFAAQAVAHEPAGPVTMRTEKLVPDFLMNIAGSVPLPDNEVPLVGVQFADASPRSLTSTGKHAWDFGDGQTSDQTNPVHVYLHPGLYTVKLAIRRTGRPFEIANRVYVDQPKVTEEAKFHKLDDYLAILSKYDPAGLDAAALRQLVLAYQWKAESLLAPPEGKSLPESTTEQQLSRAELERRQTQAASRRAEAQKYFAAAVAAGKAAFVGESAAKGDQDLVQLARLVGPMARDRLGDSPLAGSIWLGASKRITAAELKAECQTHAADVALNDLANAAAAKGFLDAATAQSGAAKTGPPAARLKRVWGDYYALTGNGKSARKAYAEADALAESRRAYIERTAWQGAHGRSTEQFLKTGELDRAIAEIRRWEEEFPADKVNGYITLLHTRYWAAREKYPQAIALAGQLVAVNSDSPYVDQILVLAADCHLDSGAVDKAVITLQSLVKDHPGSPMVPEVKKRVAELQAGGAKKPRRPARAGEK